MRGSGRFTADDDAAPHGTLARLDVAALLGTTAFTGMLMPREAAAQTWLGNTSDYGNPTNWSGGAVPTVTAFFTATGSTSVVLPAAPSSVGEFDFASNAQSYNFGVSSTFTLTATGMTSHSSTQQTFTVTGSGTLAFANIASGGPSTAIILVGPTSTLDISALTVSGIQLGSVSSASGNGQINLGARLLLVGFDDTSTLFSGVISGTGGSITKTGSGTWTLSGANTYTGGTTVIGGTLQGTTTSLQGNIVNNATVAFSQATSGTYAGTMSGSGNLLVNGTGIVTLTGSNSYSGGTTITGGLVNFASAGNFGSGAITLNGGGLQWAAGTSTDISPRLTALGAGGGTFDTNGNSVTLASAITGTGALTKAGPGMLILGGTNSYTGGTTVSGGTLQGTTASLQGNILNNATVNFSQTGNGTYAGTMSGSGGLVKSGAGTVILSGANSYTGGTTVSAGTLQGTTASLQGNILNNGTVAFSQNGGGTYAGSLSGTGGVNIQGGGVVTFTGANSYTGPTSVTGSGFVVNGSLASPVTIDSASSIGGSGSVGGLTVNGGILSPGNSIGTLTVNGTYGQNGGTYAVQLNNQGQSDRVAVNGTATLNGGTVQVAATQGSYANSTTYTIVSATGGVNGSYAGATSNFAFLTPSLSYDANDAYLTLTLASSMPFSSFNGTRNQRAVAGALNQSFATATGDWATVIGALAGLTNQQADPALTAISGEPYADIGTVNVGASLLFLNTVGQQMAVARGYGNPGSRIALAQACASATACDDTSSLSRLSAWISGIGSFGNVAGNGNASTLTYSQGGVAAGIDYRLDPRFLMGLAIGYISGRQWVDGFNGQANSNEYNAALYASFTQDGFYVDAMAGYAYGDTQVQRTMLIPNLQPRIANGRNGANEFLGQIEGGYRIGVYEPARATLTPFVRFQTVAAAQGGLTESGSANALGLIVQSQNTTSVRTVLGADLAGNIPVGAATPLVIALRLGWAHEYASTDRPVTASFLGAPSASFTVYGAQPQHDSAVIGLGLDTRLAAGMSLYARYDGEIGIDENVHAVTAGLRMTW